MPILIISCLKEAFWRTCSMNGQKAFARVTGRLVKRVSALETAKLTSKLVQNPFFNHTNHYSRCQQCPSFVTCSAEKTDTFAAKSPTHALIKCQSDLHTTLACLSKCLHITLVCVSPKNTATARWSWWHFCSQLKAIFIWCVPWYLSW